MGRFKLSVGDVFSVPIDESRVGVGQVVATRSKYAKYLAIFDAVAPDSASIEIDRALKARVIFLALSNDAKLYAGHWTVVGNRPVVAEDFPLPAWREVSSAEGRVDVVDYSGTRRRPAEEAEAELLSDQTEYAPAYLEDALRAKHGLEPWLEIYTDLAPDETRTTARLFGADAAEPQSAQTSDDQADEYDPDSEQSVFVYFTLGSEGFGTKAQRDAFFQAEEILEEELSQRGVGEIDGNEVGEGQAVLFAYGPDADALFSAMEPQLRMVPLRPAHALLRYRGSDKPEARVDL